MDGIREVWPGADVQRDQCACDGERFGVAGSDDGNDAGGVGVSDGRRRLAQWPSFAISVGGNPCGPPPCCCRRVPVPAYTHCEMCRAQCAANASWIETSLCAGRAVPVRPIPAPITRSPSIASLLPRARSREAPSITEVVAARIPPRGQRSDRDPTRYLPSTSSITKRPLRSLPCCLMAACASSLALLKPVE